MSLTEIQQVVQEELPTGVFLNTTNKLQAFVSANEDPRISVNLRTRQRDQFRFLVQLIKHVQSKQQHYCETGT